MRPRRTFLLGVKPFQEGVEDAHGNPVESHGNTVYIDVYGIAPTTSTEPTGTNLVVTGYTILAPKGTVIDHRSLVVIDGKDYKVKGEVGDWNRGPFGYDPGVTFTVERAGE